MPKTNSRPEPDAFMFRAQHPGESDDEYRTLMGRAKKKFARDGRAQAVKGLGEGMSVSTQDAGDEATKDR